MAVDTAISSRKKLEEKFIFGDVGVGAAIATLEKAGIATNRKPFIELLGADLTRNTLNKGLSQIEKAISDPTKYMTHGFFEGMTKKDAFRIYSLFPRFIVPDTAKPDCKEELNILVETANFYFFSGLWLLNWEKNSKYSEALGQLGIEEAEKRAWVSRSLYALCDYMKIHSTNPYIKPLPAPAIWLLCEISICKNRLADKPREVSKRKRYERMQKVYARLDSADPVDNLPTRAVTGLPDLAENFYGYFMYLVKQMAVDRPDFDKVLLTQYLKAQKVWGRKARDGPEAIGYL